MNYLTRITISKKKSWDRLRRHTLTIFVQYASIYAALQVSTEISYLLSRFSIHPSSHEDKDEDVLKMKNIESTCPICSLGQKRIGLFGGREGRCPDLWSLPSPFPFLIDIDDCLDKSSRHYQQATRDFLASLNRPWHFAKAWDNVAILKYYGTMRSWLFLILNVIQQCKISDCVMQIVK